MLNSSRRSKLQNLRLTLSKYDAKYSKGSAQLFDDSSEETPEEAEDEGTGIDRVSLFETGSLKSPNSSLLHGVPEKQLEDSVRGNNFDKFPEEYKEKKVSSPDTKESISSNEEEISVVESESRVDTVETDSDLAFDNVHSVSSLAESAIFMEDEAERKKASSLVCKNKNKSSSSSSLSSKDSSISQLRFNNLVKTDFSDAEVSESPQATIHLALSTHNQQTDSERQCKGKSVTDTQFIQDESKLASCEKEEGFRIVKNKTRLTEKAEILKSPSPDRNELIKKKTMQSTDEKNSDMKLPQTYKFSRPTVCLKSVAIQTSDSFIKQKTQKKACTQFPETSKYASEFPLNLPVLSSTEFPSFLREELTVSTGSPICYQQKGGTCRTENEVADLVLHHLRLISDFLERQHRLYLANCKAVQLLERGYQENNSSGVPE